MSLKLIVYVRNIIFFFYEPKNPVKFRYLEYFKQHLQILAYVLHSLLKICYFEVGPCFITSMWHNTLDVCTFLVRVKRGDP